VEHSFLDVSKLQSPELRAGSRCPSIEQAGKDGGENRMRLLTLVVTAAMAAIPRTSQTPAQKPAFEVTSIKPNRNTTLPGSLGAPGGHLLATNVPLRSILKLAYRPSDGQLFDYQIVGAPGWIDVDHFDMEAKPEGDRPIPRARFQLMLQSLLEDRFRLRTHREKRELLVYDLIAKGRPKIQLSEDQTPLAPVEAPDTGPLLRGTYQSMSDASGITIAAKAIPISTLIALLQGRGDRRIVDKTNLSGLYDFNLHYKVESLSVAPEDPPADPNGLSLFTAIEEQLGLKLESSKGPVEVLVIDSVEKPSEN
jgi:uncharacterized protein (TIGR03435 family)